MTNTMPTVALAIRRLLVAAGQGPSVLNSRGGSGCATAM